MPFTIEALIRTKFQLTSTTDIPTALITDAIAEAHDQITPHLDPTIDPESPPAALITGETLLAGALILRNLANREAATQRNTTIGGQRNDTTTRHPQLLIAANETETEAWQTLAPYLLPQPPQTPITLTDTTPILGVPSTADL